MRTRQSGITMDFGGDAGRLTKVMSAAMVAAEMIGTKMNGAGVDSRGR